MMFIKRSFCLLVFIGGMATLQAQVISESDMSARFQQKIRQINRKVYMAAVSGKVAGYHSDSLSTVLPAKEIQRIGMRIEPDASDPMKYDTMAFSPDSLLPAPGIVYHIVHEKSGVSIRRPMAMILSYQIRFNPGMILRAPICYVKIADLRKVLAPEELELLSVYAQFFQYEPAAPLISGNSINDNGLKGLWEEVMNRNLESKWGDNTCRIMTMWLIEELRGVITCSKFLYGEISLSDDSGPVAPEVFINRHLRRIDVKIPVDDDPANLKDTFYTEMPRMFDTLFFTAGKEVELCYMMNDQGTSQPRYVYRLPRSQFKRAFSPQMLRLLDLLIKD